LEALGRVVAHRAVRQHDYHAGRRVGGTAAQRRDDDVEGGGEVGVQEAGWLDLFEDRRQILLFRTDRGDRPEPRPIGVRRDDCDAVAR